MCTNNLSLCVYQRTVVPLTTFTLELVSRTGIDESKKQITALSTCPGKLPTPFLILGNLKWLEK